VSPPKDETIKDVDQSFLRIRLDVMVDLQDVVTAHTKAPAFTKLGLFMLVGVLLPRDELRFVVRVHPALQSCTSSPAKGGMSKEDLRVEGRVLSPHWMFDSNCLI